LLHLLFPVLSVPERDFPLSAVDQFCFIEGAGFLGTFLDFWQGRLLWCWRLSSAMLSGPIFFQSAGFLGTFLDFLDYLFKVGKFSVELACTLSNFGLEEITKLWGVDGNSLQFHCNILQHRRWHLHVGALQQSF
jgi:hypothetical protein